MGLRRCEAAQVDSRGQNDPNGIFGEGAAVEVLRGLLRGGKVLDLEFQSNAVGVLEYNEVVRTVVIDQTGVIPAFLSRSYVDRLFQRPMVKPRWSTAKISGATARVGRGSAEGGEP